jgi:hypothetical protein
VKFWGTARVVKRNKRLEIRTLETDSFLYTPPDFIHLHSRTSLQRLADTFMELGRRDIGAIMAFETAARPVLGRQ